MELGLVGLGKMGGNMRERIRRAGHTVVGYDRNPDVADVHSLKELVGKLSAPRVVWVMVPAGEATQATVDRLGELLEPGDVVVDGGNSRWTDDEKHAEELAAKGIGFVDCGVSGGVWGLENGYALMYGGDADNVARVQPVFDALKPEGDFGAVHAGKVGAGHFAKMVHNGIEYAMMQAYAEGWELLEKVDSVENVREVFRSWQEGTVIRSWLLDLAVNALDEDEHLGDLRGYAQDSGEGTLDCGGRDRQRGAAAGDHGVVVRAVRVPAGRLAADEDDRRAAQSVRRPRGREEVSNTRRSTPEGQHPKVGEVGETTMHVTHLSLADFRSYARVEVPLDPGVTAFVGPNGQGKTNLVEAVGYLATLGSHRVSSDAPLVRMGAERAVIRAQVRQGERQQLIELELNPGRANRARINRSTQVKPRDVLGIVRTVLFAPEDLALVKGDPGERRRFLDELITARSPRMAGVRSDYDRVLKQRNTLLKSAAARASARRPHDGPVHARRLGPAPRARGCRTAGSAPRPDRRRAAAGGQGVRAAGAGGRPRRPGVQAVGARRGAHARGPVRAADGRARRGPQAGDRAGRDPGGAAPGRSASQTRLAARQGVRVPWRVVVLRPWRCGWRRSIFSGRRAMSRSSSWTTFSPSWTRGAGSGWPSWWRPVSRCW